MKTAFAVLGFVLLLLGAGVLVTGCETDDNDEDVDPTTLPQACRDLIAFCDLCT